MTGPKSLRAISAAEGRIGEYLGRIEQAVQECSVEELPELAGQVAALAARLACLTNLRLAGTSAARSPAELENLLTAAEVAKMLRISPGEVYRRSREDLKPAAVHLSPGTLRFSAPGIQRFIRSRTG